MLNISKILYLLKYNFFMKKNETKFYSNIYRAQNNFLKLKNEKSNQTKIDKFNISRNSFSKNKNKTLSNYNIYKNSSIKSIYNIRAILENSEKFDINFIPRNLSKELMKDIKSKIYSSETLDKKNNTKTILRLYLAQIKNQKIDFIKNKFLLGQKNYYKRFVQKDDFDSAWFDSKNINPCLINNSKRYHFIKDLNENSSNSLFQNINNSCNKNNTFRINYSMKIKEKNCNTPNYIKRLTKLLFINKNNNRTKNSNIIKKTKENEYNKNKPEYNEENKSNKKEKIIDDNYNEYLKDISSSNSNKSKSDKKNINNKNHKVIIKTLKPIKKGFLLIDKSETNKDISSNKIIKNIKKLFEYKRPISIIRKNNDDINKSIAIENYFLRNKIVH